jgi:uncharacterized protein (TIGR03437 family)
LQLVVNGSNANAIALPVAGTAPGIFTQDSSGVGAGGISNADSSINSPANPAAAGSVVTIAATGEGQTTPPGVDGAIASDPAPVPEASVSVQIDGMDAIPIVLTVGGIASQAGVTLSIQ